MVVGDSLIVLAHSQSSGLLDAGILIDRGVDATQSLFWNESTDIWTFASTDTDHITGGPVNILTYSNIIAGDATFNRVKLTSGASSSYILVSDSVGLSTWVSSTSLNLISGNGTINYLSKFTSTNGLTVSQIFDTGTNVGIGTVTPTEKLEVVGNLKVNTNNLIVGNPYSSIGDNINNGVRLTIKGYGSGSSGNEILRLNDEDNNRVAVFKNDGTVGIGTSFPTEKLHVYATQSGAFRLQDTTEGLNKILVSDTNGVGTWTSSSSLSLVTGNGTSDYVPRWSSTTQLSSTSSIRDNGISVGIATQSNNSYALNVKGDVNITGTLYATSKSFEITHPTDSSKKLTYGSLEGPEYGVYYRGKITNQNVIDLPYYWTELVDENTFSINLTPIGDYQRLFVEKIENNKVYINSLDNNINCYYMIYGERKDISKIITEH